MSNERSFVLILFCEYKITNDIAHVQEKIGCFTTKINVFLNFWRF